MKFKVQKFFGALLAVFVFTFLFSPVVVLAQGGVVDLTPPANQNTNTSPINVKVTNPLKIENLNGFIKTLLEGIIKIGIPLIAIAIIYSGFMFVTALGNPEKLQKAKDAFIYAMIGGAILLGSWALAQMIADTVLQIQ